VNTVNSSPANLGSLTTTDVVYADLQPSTTIHNIKYQTPSKRRTDGRTDKSVRPFVRLSLCPLCLSEASILRGERNAMLHRNLRGGGGKIFEPGINQ